MNDIKYKNKNYNFAYRVSAFIYNADKTKIVLFYGDDMNFYMLPGGKVKEFEKSEGAIKREILEEIGFENLDFEFVGVSEELVTKEENLIHEITMIYKCVYNGIIKEEVFKSKESSWINFKWVKIEDLDNYEMHPNNIKLMIVGKNSINHVVEEKII
jgi:8-oxo-dGTP pyrophosphatase MutT (NUDIX family)